jgi:hypothetical protein
VRLAFVESHPAASYAMGKNGQTSLVVALRCAQNLPTKWPPTPLNCSKKLLRGPEEKLFHCKGGRRKN